MYFIRLELALRVGVLMLSSSFWDRYTDYIIEYWKREERVTKDRFSLISSYLDRIVYTTLLDVGCGNGNLVRYCHISSSKYLGIDSSREMVKVFKRDFPSHRTIVSDFLKCSLSKRDVVIAHSFLEHQREFWKCIEKLKRLANKALFFNVLVSTKSSLVYNPRGYWLRVLSKEDLERLKEGLSKDFSIEEVRFYARPEYYLFCQR